MADTPPKREAFPVVLTAGSLREDPQAGWLVPHAWTDGEVITHRRSPRRRTPC